ncbi:MAG: DHA2 family efflux MFS transporter permease subunit, partial [bacterium]|nr:DHA2 family efflux MFS transporter permease subunit [bacterium]
MAAAPARQPEGGVFMTRLRGNPWAVLVSLCLGFFMILLDTTIVNIAVPGLMNGLHASLDEVLWVVNAYTLVYAVLLVTGGRLGDLVGRKQLFVGGMALFTLASIGCGVAQNPTELIAARALQGVGGALLTPQTLSTVMVTFPPERRGAAFGVWGAVAGVAAVAGPVLGGYLVTNFGWRWIFFVNVPICAVSIALALLVIPGGQALQRHRIDLPGVLLATLGLVGITFGLIEGQQYSWGQVWGPVSIPLILGAGLALLVVFGAWQYASRAGEPLVPFAVFRNRNFALMNLAGAALQFGVLGLFLPIVIFLQAVVGLSAFDAGLTLAPLAAVSMVVAPFAGRLADRLGGKYVLLAGLTIFGAGMLVMDGLTRFDAGRWTLLPGILIAGFGMGATYAPLQTVAMRTIEPRLAGAASGLINTTRQLGGVLGSAAVGALLQNRLAVTLHDAAVQGAGSLPSGVRAQFVQGFGDVASHGLEAGAAGGGVSLPAGVPAQLAAQIQHLGAEVFARGYTDAMRPALLLPIAVVWLGALTCVFVRSRAGRQETGQEARQAAAPAPVVRIAAPASPAARAVASGVAERLGVSLLDLTGDPAALADALHAALRAHREDVAGLLARAAAGEVDLAAEVMDLAAESGAVI